MTIRQGLPKTKEGLPKEAFAIVGDPEDPETWKLPYHQKATVGRGLMPALKKYWQQPDTWLIITGKQVSRYPIP